MSPLLGLVTAIVVAGAVVSVAARDARLSLLGLTAALLVAPLTADPPPSLPALGARTVASALGLYIAWIAIRDSRPTARGSALGWPAEAIAGLAAVLAGVGIASGAGDALGRSADSPAALGACLALLVLSAGPLAAVRDPLRFGNGLVLLAIAGCLVWSGLAASSGSIDQVLAGCIGLGALGCQAVLVRSLAPAR